MLLPEKWLWHKPKDNDAKVENGYIYYISSIEFYHPFDFSYLPNQLAKVIDENSAIKFVNSYGSLGYKEFFDEEQFLNEELWPLRYGDNCDPFDWFLLQTKTIRFVLYLIEAIYENGGKDLKELIEEDSITRDIEDKKNSSTKEEKVHRVAIGCEEGFIKSPIERAELRGVSTNEQYRILALELAAYLISINSSGVHRGIAYETDYDSYNRPVPKEPLKVVPRFFANSLVEGIWHQVGDILLASQKIGGKGVRICEECGMPFIYYDNRQIYCPKDEYSHGSLCGNRKRTREFRRGGGRK